MASISQLKISHARYGYLYSRLGSASAGGGSTRYETSFSTTGRVLRLRWVKVEATGQFAGFDRSTAGDAGRRGEVAGTRLFARFRAGETPGMTAG